MTHEPGNKQPATSGAGGDFFARGVRGVRLLVGALVAALAIVVLASALVAYVARLLCCDALADRWGGPLVWLVRNPPSWPLVVLVLITLGLTVFFAPIESFLTRLRKGPFGTVAAPHPPTSQDAQPSPGTSIARSSSLVGVSSPPVAQSAHAAAPVERDRQADSPTPVPPSKD